MKSGVVAMRKAVTAYFAAHGVTANVSLGWRDRWKQTNQGTGGANRVVFELADDAGKITAPHGPGDVYGDLDTDGNPTASAAALYTWEQAVTVNVWARDATSPEDQEAQIEATETLFEWTLRAVRDFAPVAPEWGAVKRTVAERQNGLEIRASLTLKQPLFDEPESIVYPSPAVSRADA